MKTVGITGQSGFIGTHLFNYLNLKDDITLVPFSDSFFNDCELLTSWASQCDVIVHLAGINRHADPSTLYDTNIKLVKDLTYVLGKAGKRPHLIFSSSTQEERDNAYGKSKKEGRSHLISWSEKHSSVFTGLLIPNVFGPFGNPFYNSVIATFSYQLTHQLSPAIDNDAELKLIYVGELVREIYNIIQSGRSNSEYQVPYTTKIKVSGILQLLHKFKSEYFENGIFPELHNIFEVNLFNTFRSFIDHKKQYPFPLKRNSDDRGSFVEILKTAQGGQISFSTTKPGITRGNHFHTRKIERFAVIKGSAKIQLRRIGTDEVLDFDVNGDNPTFVDMPVWYTHNLINTGTEELYAIFWINEFFDPADPDTFSRPV